MKTSPSFRGIGLLLTVCLQASLASAQREREVPNPWSLRAHIITESLIKDATTLSSPERPLLWAKLGELWWKDDPQNARAWLEKAVSDATIVPDQESTADYQRRLSVIRALVAIIFPRDKRLGAKLAELLVSRSEASKDIERGENARALLDAALTALDTDQHLAVELAGASLRAGRTYGYNVLLWKLRSRDTKLADALFNEMLVASRAGYDYNLLTALMYAAYPQTLSPSSSRPVPPDELRRGFLNVLADNLLRHTTSPNEEAATCRLAASTSPLFNEFLRLLPQRASAVSVIITRCQVTSPQPFRQRVDDSLRRDIPFKTADEIIKAADEMPGSKNRAYYISRAVNIAAQQQKFEQAVAILDGISTEVREQLGEAWENWRWAFASSAAVVYFKQNDLPAMQKVIDATPANLRPLVQIAVSKELAGNGAEARAIELFREGRNVLAKGDMPNKDLWYLTLIHLYAKYLPTDAPEVFREMVAAMNRIEQSNPSSSQAADAGSNAGTASLGDPIKLPASLLEADELNVLQAISSIQSPSGRVRVRLALLAGSLDQMRTYPNRNKPALSEVKGNGSQ